MKAKIYFQPTSKLIYHRVYRENSPFSFDDIMSELKRRKNVSLDTSYEGGSREDVLAHALKEKNDDSLKSRFRRTFTPHCVRLEEEEYKCIIRGEDIDSYLFDSDHDFYKTFAKLLFLIENSWHIKSAQVLIERLLATLTWSEQVLLERIAWKMIGILETRTEQPSLKDWESIIRRKNDRRLLEFFRAYYNSFCNKIVYEGMEKSAKKIFMSSESSLSSLDVFQFEHCIRKEEKLYSGDVLDRSIDELADSPSDITESIKSHLIKPIDPSK